jgi:hypothetical protein
MVYRFCGMLPYDFNTNLRNLVNPNLNRKFEKSISPYFISSEKNPGFCMKIPGFFIGKLPYINSIYPNH